LIVGFLFSHRRQQNHGTKFANPYGESASYLQLLGIFHSNWSAIDLYTDFAIYQFLHVTPQQAHLITSGMMFGRKARLLADLIKHSDDPRKPKLLESFNKIRAAKRDIIAHSYVGSDALSVWYLERNTSGPFKAEVHSYSAERLRGYVQGIANAASDFYNALGVERAEIDAFANAALSLNRKSSTSPESPVESK
jgi:hypothetical protein